MTIFHALKYDVAAILKDGNVFYHNVPPDVYYSYRRKLSNEIVVRGSFYVTLEVKRDLLTKALFEYEPV